MIICFIAALVVIFSTSLFFLSYQINGLNVMVVSTPISIIENCTLYNESKNVAYIDEDLILEKLTYYYLDRSKQYVSNFNLNFYYYNKEDYSYCTTQSCSGFEVTYRANLMYGYSYKRTMYFEVSENF